MAQLTLRFAQAARSELNDLLAYIAFDNPAAASKLAGKIEKSLDRLVEFPDSGRAIPEAHRSRLPVAQQRSNPAQKPVYFEQDSCSARQEFDSLSRI